MRHSFASAKYVGANCNRTNNPSSRYCNSHYSYSNPLELFLPFQIFYLALTARRVCYRFVLFYLIFFCFTLLLTDWLIRRIIARFDAQMAGSECKRRLEHARSLVFHEVAVRFPFLSRALSFSFARKITELLSEARFRSNLNLRSIEHTERIVVISSIAQPTFLATV